MERLTKCIDNHFPDVRKMVKEYVLNDEIEFNDYSCMDIPKEVYNKLGELEDVLEKYGIESAEELEMLLSANSKIKTNTFNSIKKLKHQLAVKDKALELCERHHIGFEKAILPKQVDWIETRIKENTAYFTKQAEKELKE